MFTIALIVLASSVAGLFAATFVQFSENSPNKFRTRELLYHSFSGLESMLVAKNYGFSSLKTYQGQTLYVTQIRCATKRIIR